MRSIGSWPQSNLGDALFALHDCEAARAAYERARNLDPSIDGPYIGFGNLYLLRHEGRQAADAYRRALALDPNEARAESNLGVALVNIHRDTEA
jgi:Flp pilus assembly protein TadD